MDNNLTKKLIEISKEAGDLLMDYFYRDLEIVDKKSHQDIVTEADKASQDLIKDSIIKSAELLGYKKSEIGFIGEENLKSEGKHLFIIDPLDGTTSFAAGLPYFCISIAYYSGKIETGVVHNPVTGVTYYADRGRGAYKLVNGKVYSLEYTDKKLTSSIFSPHFNGESFDKRIHFDLCEYLEPKVRGIRNAGSIALDMAMYADNVYGVILNGCCFLWDIAAASLIVKESGGSVTDWKGDPVDFVLDNPDHLYKILLCSDNVQREIRPILTGNL